MRRFYFGLLTAAWVVPGCMIEQTPESYIDHLATPAAEIDASREELTDRLLSIGVALQREDGASVMAALVPVSGVVVYGPRHEEQLTTPDAVVDGLMEQARDLDVSMQIPTVEVGANNSVAWFRTTFLINGGQTDAADVRFSGVFLRQEGDWRLTQGHISRVIPVPLSPPDSLPADGTPAGAG